MKSSFKISKYIPAVVMSLLVLLLISLSLFMPGDPDLGWHIQNGADIIKNFSLPSGDIYSWTMPGYPWTPHEWGADVIMAALNSAWGLWALVVLFGVIISSAFYIVSGAVTTSRPIRLLVAIMGVLISWSIVGVRPQMITLLGIAIVLYLIFNWRNQPKSKLLWWFPLLFFVWANLHGGFPIAFIVIALFGIGEIIRYVLAAGSKGQPASPKLDYLDFVELIKWSGIGFLVTFINPNGWKVYLELYQTFMDRDILNQIMEWLPVSLMSAGSYNMALVTVLILVLLVINRGKIDTTKLIMVVAMFFFSITSWRHIPIFTLVAMVLLAEQLDYLIKKDITQILNTFAGVASLLLITILVAVWQIPKINYIVNNPQSFGTVFGYPYEAVEYLKEHPELGDKMFNEYGWGGYLIWQYPERQVFIDGRMAIWKDPDFSIFDEAGYITGPDEEDSLSALDRWEIDIVLVNVKRPINRYLRLLPDKWSVEYQDAYATIWKKI